MVMTKTITTSLLLNLINLKRRYKMNINKIYGKKTIDNLEQEYEELNLVDLVKMKFTLQAHTQAIIQLIKKKKGGKVKTVNYTYEKQRRQYDYR
jgi:helix-turn-helix protein